MRPEKFDSLKKTDDGRPIITLMTDPDLSAGFLSVVDRGANGRVFAVAKRDGDDKTTTQKASEGGIPDAGGLTGSLGYEPTEMVGVAPSKRAGAWFGDIFGGLWNRLVTVTGGVSTAQKAESPYEVAVMGPKVWEAFREASNALDGAIWRIMCEEEITDKRAALQMAIQQHAAHLARLIDDIPVLTPAQSVEMGTALKACGPDKVQKAGRKISQANRAKLAQAMETIKGLLALDEPANDNSGGGDADEGEDDEMDTEKVAKAADLAGKSAAGTAKTLGLSVAEQQAAYERAAATVFKAAVMGPAQPALQTDALAKQVTMSGGSDGAGSPQAGIDSALGRNLQELTARVQKMESDAAANQAQIEGAIEKIATAIKSLAGVPAAPAALAADRSETTQKADDKSHPLKGLMG